LSIEPLLALFSENEDLTSADISEVCGFSRKTYFRMREGGITSTWAERIAHKLGLHPLEIWGSAYTFVCEAEDAAAGRN
jgi:lambda repressor-like predicted transcriptional regulator